MDDSPKTTLDMSRVLAEWKSIVDVVLFITTI